MIKLWIMAKFHGYCLCQITRWYASTTPEDIISQLLGIETTQVDSLLEMRKWSRWFFRPTQGEPVSLDFYALIWCSTVPFREIWGLNNWAPQGLNMIEPWRSRFLSEAPVIFRRSVTLVFGHANKLPGCYMLAGRQIDLTVDDQPEQRLKSAAPAAPDLWDRRNLSRGFPLHVLTKREGILYLQGTQHTGIHRKTTVGRGCKRDEKKLNMLTVFQGILRVDHGAILQQFLRLVKEKKWPGCFLPLALKLPEVPNVPTGRRPSSAKVTGQYRESTQYIPPLR